MKKSFLFLHTVKLSIKRHFESTRRAQLHHLLTNTAHLQLWVARSQSRQSLRASPPLNDQLFSANSSSNSESVRMRIAMLQ
jgi:hypothetical protein